MAGPVAGWAAKAAASKTASDPAFRRIVVGAAAILLLLPVAVVVVPVVAVVTFITSIDPNMQYCAAPYRTATQSDWTPESMTVPQLATATAVRDAAAAVTEEPKAMLAAVMAAFLATDMGAEGMSPRVHPTDDTPVGVYARTVRGGWGTLDELTDIPTATARILKGNGPDRAGIMNDSAWVEQPVGAWMAAIGMADKPAGEIATAADKARRWLAFTGSTIAGTGATCGGNTGPVSADQVKLATDLMAAFAEGRIMGGDIQQIRDIAAGNSVPDCAVDVRILQILTIALQHFTTVGFSDINRKCTGVLAGAGIGSTHWINGGGHAIDLTFLDGSLDGGATEIQSAKFIRILEPLMPPGARVGQLECRASNPVSTTNLVQFDDDCDHLHIDVGYTDAWLAVSR